MEQSNEEKDLFAFSWPLFFTVTGVSLLFFSTAMKLLEGGHVKVFLYAGGTALILGILAWLGSRRS